MDLTTRDKYLRRLSTLKNDRSSFDTHWRTLADYVLPRSVVFSTADRNKGGSVNQNILNPTATYALRTLASGMMAGLTSPARPWFRLTTGDPDLSESGEVKEWLFDVEMTMREVFARSNLYNILPKVYADLGLYGTSAFEVLEDFDDVIRCYPYSVGEFWLSQSHRLQVDTVYREIAMTVAQIVGQFGLDNCSQSIKDQWDRGNHDQYFDVVHVIEPNVEYDERKALAKFKKYRVCYFEKGGKEDKYLAEAGFDEFPVLAPRWSLPGNNVYGESPGMHCLGDIKALQLESKRKLQAIDKMVNPPMLGDASLRNQRVSMLPGDITYINGLSTSSAPGFRPAYEINPRINELMLEIQETEARIRRGFYEDLMLMFATSDGDTQRTAREVEERHQEKLLVLGPVMERLNDELLDPLIDRTFAIMLRKGLIPPAPERIQGQDLRVEYISIMAQAQKMIGTAGIERVLGIVGNMAAVKPNVLDKVDFDQAIDEYSNMLGVPPRMIRSDEAVASIRAQQAAKEQAAAMASMAQPMQQVATAAKTLSEADVETDNGLTRLMQQMGVA